MRLRVPTPRPTARRPIGLTRRAPAARRPRRSARPGLAPEPKSCVLANSQIPWPATAQLRATNPASRRSAQMVQPPRPDRHPSREPRHREPPASTPSRIVLAGTVPVPPADPSGPLPTPTRRRTPRRRTRRHPGRHPQHRPPAPPGRNPPHPARFPLRPKSATWPSRHPRSATTASSRQPPLTSRRRGHPRPAPLTSPKGRRRC